MIDHKKIARSVAELMVMAAFNRWASRGSLSPDTQLLEELAAGAAAVPEAVARGASIERYAEARLLLRLREYQSYRDVAGLSQK